MRYIRPFINRLTTWVGALVFLMVLGLLWVLGIGSGAQDVADAGSSETLAQADEEASEEDEIAETMTIEVTYEHFLARDPFQSVRPPEPEAPDPTDPTDPTPPAPGVPTDPTDPTVPVTPPPGNGDEPAQLCRTNGETVCDGRVVTVEAVEDSTTTVVVDTVVYNVQPGDLFAERFTAVSVSGDCAQLLYQRGDQAVAFTQCVGDEDQK